MLKNKIEEYHMIAGSSQIKTKKTELKNVNK